MKFRLSIIEIIIVIVIVGIIAAFVLAGRGYDPEYEANRALQTALLGEIFTGDDEADYAEIDRLMELPRDVMAFPTGELARVHWLFVDESLEYAIEFDWTENWSVKGKVVFDRTVKRKKR